MSAWPEVLIGASGVVGLGFIFAIVAEPMKEPRAADGPGCHSVACGNLIGLPGSDKCGVFVDGRVVFITYDGQLALNFIAKNGLKTCEAKP